MCVFTHAIDEPLLRLPYPGGLSRLAILPNCEVESQQRSEELIRDTVKAGGEEVKVERIRRQVADKW